jgi:glycosyltransferase involved in cell wall biosynthesis
VKRLLLVSQRPQEYGGVGSSRWNAFRAMLPEHGWEVEVVTARPNATANEHAEDAAGQRLYAVRTAVMGRAGALMRPVVRRAGVEPEALAPSALWGLTGRRAVRDAIARHRPDAIWATSPPVAAHLVMAGLELTVPYVAELRDHWAGNPYYDAGGTLLTRLESRPLAAAAAVVCVTPQAADRLRRLHPGLAPRVLPNGFDPALLERREPRRPGRPATLVHAGALYGGRTLAALHEALAAPALAGRVRLDVFGPGTPAGPVDAQTARERVAAADLALVVFTPGEETAVPGKLYEALALGKPVLALGGADSAMAALLRELGQDAGLAPPDDPAAILAALERLLTEPPEPVAPARLDPYDRARVAADYAALLSELA